MPVDPTRFSRVSVGWRSSTQSLVDVDPGDTGAVFSVTGPYAFDGALTLTGDQTITGDVDITGDQTLVGATSDLSVGGTAWIGGTLTQIGAATLSSTLSVAGNLSATGGLFVGNSAAANELVSVSIQTHSVAFGAVGANYFSKVTVGVSNATRGDLIIFQPDSSWTGDGLVLTNYVSGTTAGEVNLVASNTSTAAIGQSAVVFRSVRINFASYI